MDKVIILVAAANPEGTPLLNTNNEIKALQQGLDNGLMRDSFDAIRYCPEASAQELISCIERFRPHVVHFSGHGTQQEELLFSEVREIEEREGDKAVRHRRETVSQPIGTDALATIFRLGAPYLKLVVLSACYSVAQAKAIAQDVSCVVGIEGKTHGVYAEQFARGFYRALANDYSVADAIQVAEIEIGLPPRIVQAPPPTVALQCKPDVKPNNLYLIREAALFAAPRPLLLPRPSLAQRIQMWSGGTVTALSLLFGLLLTFPMLREALVAIVPGAQGFPRTLQWTIIGIVCLAGARVYVRGRARVSRLAPGASLQLDSDNPNYLLGRQEDIANLGGLCKEFLQVHLVGETGSGKTALVRAGLIPDLRTGAAVIPVYVNSYGHHWSKGPIYALAECLWDALSSEQRTNLGMARRRDPANVTSHLARVRNITGCLPLLIFDQFDDYQVRHSARFLDEKRKAWISSEELTQRNSFWDTVKCLIQQDQVHSLFVTRADTAAGLISVQFVRPQVYPVTRLPTHLAKDIMERVTTSVARASPVVIDPEYGWEKLRERLARDLDEAGTILPVRLKLALLGLPRLRALTVSAYVRYGGLPALEAGFLEWHIRQAARPKGGLDEDRVRQLLLKMTDLDTLKPVEKTRDELGRFWDWTGVHLEDPVSQHQQTSYGERTADSPEQTSNSRNDLSNTGGSP
jgi:hypothetical protein